MNAALGQKKAVMTAWFMVVAVAAGQFFLLAIGGQDYRINPVGIGALALTALLGRFIAKGHNWARFLTAILAAAWGGLFFYRAVLYVLHMQNFIWGMLQGVALICCFVVAGVLLFSKDLRAYFKHPDLAASHEQRRRVRHRR